MVTRDSSSTDTTLLASIHEHGEDDDADGDTDIHVTNDDLGASDAAKIPNNLSTFDEEEFVSYFIERKRCRTTSSDSTCYRKRRQQQVQSQGMLLNFLKGLSIVDTFNCKYRIYVMSAYICQVNESVNVKSYLLPTLSHKIFLNVLLELYVLPRRTFNTWRGSLGPSRPILPFDHFLVNRQSNNYKTSTRDAFSVR